MIDEDFIIPLFSLLQYSEANQYSEIGDEVTTTEVWVLTNIYFKTTIQLAILLAVAATASTLVAARIFKSVVGMRLHALITHAQSNVETVCLCL